MPFGGAPKSRTSLIGEDKLDPFGEGQRSVLAFPWRGNRNAKNAIWLLKPTRLRATKTINVFLNAAASPLSSHLRAVANTFTTV